MKSKASNTKSSDRNASTSSGEPKPDLRHKILCKDFLARVNTTEVASIAASLPGNMSSIDRVKTAFELLDIAEWIKNEAFPDSFGFGYEIQNQQEKGKSFDGAIANLVATQKREARRHDTTAAFVAANNDILSSKEKTIPLDIVMGRLFDRSTRKSDRPIRLEMFVDDAGWFSLDFNFSELKTPQDVMNNWREKGVSKDNFHVLWMEYPDWWRKRVATLRSKAGKSKTNPNKGKQGRVLRASDRRLGARPPEIF
jgi:hypothetical protein